MDLEQDLPVAHPEFDRLVNHVDRGATVDPAEEVLDVLGVETDATVADPSTDTVGFVGPMDAVSLLAESEPVVAERVIRPGGDEAGKGRVFSANCLRYAPRRPDGFVQNGEFPERGLPSINSDADRVDAH